MRETVRALGVLPLLFGAASVGFHLYLVFAGLWPHLVTRPLHLMLAIPWVFFLGAEGGRLSRWSGYALGVLGLASGAYIIAYHRPLADQYGSLEGWLQITVAILLIVTVLEMARRAIKAVLPAVAAVVLLYGAFGHLVPGHFGHGELPAGYFLGTLVITEGGLWSTLTGVSVGVIAPFIILGAFISAGAAGTGFMALAQQVAGRFRAGAAKVAVLSSAMYGTISGVAAANTASTGMVTIPAMKRLGYPPSLAAAVEVVASTGGQIMPPLMGATVFVMAELLHRPYLEIMGAATPPAVLFFLTAWWGVHQFAIRLNLRPMGTADLPGWGLVARTVPFFLVPFTILIVFLAFTRFTPAYAAAVAIVVTVLMLIADPDGRVSLSGWLSRILTGIVGAGRQVANIAAIIVCASLIVGVFNMTGIGVKITSLILSASGGDLWLALLLTGLASLVLGMELPTTAAYIIAVAVAGPALVELGLPELYAHMFVFWYALLCTITPPVCGNVFIAAGIAQTPWIPVSLRAMQLGIGLFIVPLGFVSNPSLLALSEAPILTLLATAKVGLGVWLISFAAIDPFRRWWSRPVAMVLGAAVIFLGGV
nr:TRAP transporter fused permease subunit [Roseospira navarrensis]